MCVWVWFSEAINDMCQLWSLETPPHQKLLSSLVVDVDLQVNNRDLI